MFKNKHTEMVLSSGRDLKKLHLDPMSSQKDSTVFCLLQAGAALEITMYHATHSRGLN